MDITQEASEDLHHQEDTALHHQDTATAIWEAHTHQCMDLTHHHQSSTMMMGQD